MKYGATYGNRNPKPGGNDEDMVREVFDYKRKVENLMAKPGGREAIREALDEAQAAAEFAMYRGRSRVFPADEWGAERVLDAAVYGGVNIQTDPDEPTRNKYGGLE